MVMFLALFFTFAFFLPSSASNPFPQQMDILEGDRTTLCPLDDHVVCNQNEREARCVCTMVDSGSPAPEQSCTNLLNSSGNGIPEVVSVNVRLEPSFFPSSNETNKWAVGYFENKFKAQIALEFKTLQKNVIFLRLRCRENVSPAEVTVQLIVLRKYRPISPPYSKAQIMDAQTTVNRIRRMRQSPHRVGGMQLANVEKVSELIPVEMDTDNSRLVTQAIVVGAFMLMTCFCGCWVAMRRKRPEDEGYEVQQSEKV